MDSQDKKKVSAPNRYLQGNAITVVIPISLWNGSVGEELRTVFAAPIMGLHSHEALFTLHPVHSSYLSGDVKVSRNILIVSNQFKNKVSYVNDKFTKQQHIFTLEGSNETKLLELIQLHAKEIKEKFYNSEISHLLEHVDLNLKLQQKVRKKFAIDMIIPKAYVKGLEGENFMWLRKEVGAGHNNILLYTASYSALYNKNPFITNTLFIRNQVTKKYVLGKTKGSFMIAEQSYYPNFSTTRIHTNLAYEMRGSWEFHNDVMHGPFINFAIRDSKRKRFIIVDGFTYSPTHSKKALLFEMEALIKSIKSL
jgi:hypothetical protein